MSEVGAEGRVSRFWARLEGRSTMERRLSKVVEPLIYRGRLGDGGPVMVIPGYNADDGASSGFRRILRRLDHDAFGWGQGPNEGIGGGLLDTVGTELAAWHERADRRVAVIGFSLGGLAALELAYNYPEDIRLLVLIGAPVADRWAERGEPDVPVTSVYSKSDGVVGWRASLLPAGERAENVVVRGSHVGMGSNALVTRVVADRLQVDPDRWYPFRASGWFKFAAPRQPA